MKVLLFTNTAKGLASEVAGEAGAWLASRGIEYELLPSGIFEEGGERLRELAASIGTFDFMCSFGGDGTTLRAAHLVGRSGVPLLSYNFGKLGFLSGAGAGDLIPALEAAVEGRLTYDARTMLSLRVAYESGRVDTQIALNEVVVSRGHFGRIVALDLLINGTLIDTIEGDGVLVATPTGSTAYALSAGGPIISPAHEGLCVVPISPHSLTTRAIVTARDDVIRLEPNRLNRQRLVLFIDGEVFWIDAGGGGAGAEGAAEAGAGAGSAAGSADDADEARDEITSVEVAGCAERLMFARLGPYDFYDHVAQTFFRGSHAR
ncbi:MAG: NAD(+)/NADH kinase [Coriobacteriales bacterium]|jgi:NAD+ kinase|nr:NAD(+)/NADH kinase [Coriobacteriales bacterium]